MVGRFDFENSPLLMFLALVLTAEACICGVESVDMKKFSLDFIQCSVSVERVEQVAGRPG